MSGVKARLFGGIVLGLLIASCSTVMPLAEAMAHPGAVHSCCARRATGKKGAAKAASGDCCLRAPLPIRPANAPPPMALAWTMATPGPMFRAQRRPVAVSNSPTGPPGRDAAASRAPPTLA